MTAVDLKTRFRSHIRRTIEVTLTVTGGETLTFSGIPFAGGDAFCEWFRGRAWS
jgi:hypothetical protein